MSSSKLFRHSTQSPGPMSALTTSPPCGRLPRQRDRPWRQGREIGKSCACGRGHSRRPWQRSSVASRGPLRRSRAAWGWSSVGLQGVGETRDAPRVGCCGGRSPTRAEPGGTVPRLTWQYRGGEAAVKLLAIDKRTIHTAICGVLCKQCLITIEDFYGRLQLMKTLSIRGGITLLDDDDWEWATQYEWHAVHTKQENPANRTYYVYRYEKGVGVFRMHRELMKPEGKLWVDHRDFCGWNNQRHNLRVCTPTQNQANQRPRGASGFRGVYYLRGKWMAQIKSNGTNIYLGCYTTPEEAARVWDEKAFELWGDFALLNFNLN